MNVARGTVYRSCQLGDAGDEAVRFRLFYEGPLLSANSDQRPRAYNRLANHKHAIRMQFHRQFERLWETNKYLRSDSNYNDFRQTGMWRPTSVLKDTVRDGMPALGKVRFLPLVCGLFDIWCGLGVLLLRRDAPGGIFQTRDLDNRLKVLFDALRMPRGLTELGSVDTSQEQTFFVLLEDDSLITHVSVETDELLEAPDQADDSLVRLLISVSLGPLHYNGANAGFL